MRKFRCESLPEGPAEPARPTTGPHLRKADHAIAPDANECVRGDCIQIRALPSPLPTARPKISFRPDTSRPPCRIRRKTRPAGFVPRRFSCRHSHRNFGSRNVPYAPEVAGSARRKPAERHREHDTHDLRTQHRGSAEPSRSCGPRIRCVRTGRRSGRYSENAAGCACRPSIPRERRTHTPSLRSATFP